MIEFSSRYVTFFLNFTNGKLMEFKRQDLYITYIKNRN